MPDPNSIADILDKAASLIEPAGKWTSGSFARDGIGRDVCPNDPAATCWCMWGATMRSAGQERLEVTAALRRAVPTRRIVDFNDAPGRTQAEVVSALREAAAKAREQGL